MRILGLIGLAILGPGCANKRGPAAAVDGFDLPALGTLVVVSDIVERRGSGKPAVTTTKRYHYRHQVRTIEGGGLEVGTPTVVVERYTIDGKGPPASDLARLGPMLANTRPAFEVGPDGQFVGLSSSVSDADLPMDRITMASTMRDRWRLVTEGWSGIEDVGDAATEKVNEPMPGKPNLLLVMTVTRERLPDGPCIDQPQQSCRRRALRSEVRTGPIVGEFVATITDHPGQSWPHRVEIVRTSRGSGFGSAPELVLSTVERTELWPWEAAE